MRCYDPRTTFHTVLPELSVDFMSLDVDSVTIRFDSCFSVICKYTEPVS